MTSPCHWQVVPRFANNLMELGTFSLSETLLTSTQVWTANTDFSVIVLKEAVINHFAKYASKGEQTSKTYSEILAALVRRNDQTGSAKRVIRQLLTSRKKLCISLRAGLYIGLLDRLTDGLREPEQTWREVFERFQNRQDETIGSFSFPHVADEIEFRQIDDVLIDFLREPDMTLSRLNPNSVLNDPLGRRTIDEAHKFQALRISSIAARNTPSLSNQTPSITLLDFQRNEYDWSEVAI